MKRLPRRALCSVLVLSLLLPGFPAAQEDDDSLPALESLKSEGSADWEGRKQGDRALMAIGVLFTTFGLVRYFQGDRNAAKWDLDLRPDHRPRRRGDDALGTGSIGPEQQGTAGGRMSAAAGLIGRKGP